MKISKSDAKSRVYGRICAGIPGAVWTPGDFGDFGSRDAVDKALQRLVAAGKLRRIDWGLYDRPHINRLTGKPTAADYRAVIEAVSRRDHTRMLIDGMTAANDLGLSDAVPGRVIVHSDARIKPVQIGNLIIKFRPTSASKLKWAGRPAMWVVQALHWLKPKLANSDENQRIRRRIKDLLSDPKKGPPLRRDIAQDISSLPAWMRNFLRSIDSMDEVKPPQRRRRQSGNRSRRKAEMG